jgi:transcriptional repressor NF-X1
MTQTPPDDLAESIWREIANSAYTCLVCTDYVTPTSQIWACHNCYRAFDLDCIRDWAKRGSSTQDDHSWRCPSCNFSHVKIPKHYTCWCGKSINPNVNYLEPHSCGNSCSTPLSDCSHNCTKTCHPGPHIEKCTAMGPSMKCHCGKHERQLPCVQTPYDKGWSCETPCNDFLSCGIHRCQKKCHTGICGECDWIIDDVKCYCGKSKTDLHCHDRVPKKSVDPNTDETWIGGFECVEECNELLDCGVHKCALHCHPVDKDCHKCPNAPTNLIFCPCGKEKISDLIDTPRTSCLDPIPTCAKVCGKRLPCGHKCYWTCHDGECAPCYRSVDVDCHCGFTHYSIACKLNTEGYRPTCQTKCNAKFNCKRHFCTKKCCEYRQIAADRSKILKKQIRNNIITNSIADQQVYEEVHTCEKVCNLLLSCGKHHCQQICHSGPCPPCLESSSEDLVCHCGRTVVPAPVRCGTLPPVCQFQCERPKVCGHRLEPHHCHEDDIPCPKCTALVTKRCQCEKQLLVTNVMCYQEIVSCFRVCDKLLGCGEHRCKKTCHKPGECTQRCTEKCLKLKKCGHPCQQVCHSGKPCNEDLPCKETVVITCKCGRRKQSMLCFAVTKMIKDETSRREQEKVEAAESLTVESEALKDSDDAPYTGIELNLEANCDSRADTPTVEGSEVEDYIPQIACDEVCDKERRNKLLFEALGLNPEKTKETETSMRMKTVETLYTPFVIGIYGKQKTWCKGIEDVYKQLLSHTVDSSFKDLTNAQLKQSHHFRPMRAIQRKFVKELAATWGLFAQSHDQEPKRSVSVKLLKASSIPDLDLEEAYGIYLKYKVIEKRKAAEKSMRVTESVIKDGERSNSYYNGIIIKDVFFGVSVDTIDAAVYNLWNIKEGNEDSEMKKFSLIRNGKVEYVSETMYVFYGEELPLNDAEVRLQYEGQILELCGLFDEQLKAKNMALKCVPAKIDLKEGIVLEIAENYMPSVEESVDADDQKSVASTDDVLKSIEDLKIESTTVSSSDWW